MPNSYGSALSVLLPSYLYPNFVLPQVHISISSRDTCFQHRVTLIDSLAFTSLSSLGLMKTLVLFDGQSRSDGPQRSENCCISSSFSTTLTLNYWALCYFFLCCTSLQNKRLLEFKKKKNPFTFSSDCISFLWLAFVFKAVIFKA